MEQREQLENIEKRCDGIDANLVNAQQNLNRLGSVFGGIKNYFSPPKTAFPKSVSQPQLSNNAAKKKAAAAQETAAAMSARSTNPKQDTDTYFGKPHSAMDDMERETEKGLGKCLVNISRQIDASLSDVLGDIHLGVNRLKMLALQMNEELESQKPLTHRLGKKFEVLNGEVEKKNKNMKNILLS